MSRILYSKKRCIVRFKSILCTFLGLLLIFSVNILQPVPAKAVVNYTELRFDASSQVGGNIITEFVDSPGIIGDGTGLPQNWAKTRYDNMQKYTIANTAIWSHKDNPDGGYLENGGTITYTGNRGSNYSTTGEMLGFWLHAGVKPIVFFHGVPAVLSGGYVQGEYGFNIALPTDTNMGKYRQYIAAVAQYLVDRFGFDEVSQWIFEFAAEPDWQLSGTAAARSKTMDYWLAGLEDVLGEGNVYAGTYYANHPDNSILNGMVTHFGEETNYATGQTGTSLSFMGTTTWLWNNNDLNMNYLKNQLSNYQKAYQQFSPLNKTMYGSLEHGRGEPGIIVSWADNFGAAYYAFQNDVYTQFPVKKRIINYGDWGTNGDNFLTDPHLFTPAFNMYRIERDMAGQRLLPVSIAGARANSANLVGGYASALDESTRKYSIVAYNFNTDYNTNVSENIRILLDNLPGTQATVSEYVIDSNNNNWWTDWRTYRETGNYVPYIDRTGGAVYPSWTLPITWDTFQTTDESGYAKWKAKAPEYEARQDLQITNGPTTVNINDGILEINRTLPGHSILYITIETSPVTSSSGNNTDFESGSLNGWTTSGTVTMDDTDVKDGDYSIKLEDMDTVEAYAKQTVTGLVAGERYTLSGWAKPEGANIEYGIYIQRPGESASRTTGYGTTLPLREWNRLAVTLEADSNGQLEIGVIAPNQINRNPVFFDSLRLQRSGVTNETAWELAHFKFDENSGTSTNDSSFHGYNGSVNGATWATGKYGSALSFDGTNSKYVEIAGQCLNIGSDFSITGWFKAPQDRSKWHVILAKGPKDMGHFEIGIDPLGQLYFYAPDMDMESYVAGTVDDNNWHHFAVIRKGNSLKIFIDKNESLSATSQNIIVTENENIRIGTLLDGTLPFNGLIDDVQIFSGALTQLQLNDVYDGNEAYVRPVPTPIPTPTAPSVTPMPMTYPTPAPTPAQIPNYLIGDWELNENSGDIVHDTSVSSNDGSITGAAWTTGKYGNALSFNGLNNYVSISNAANLGNNFSISAWIKAAQDRSNWHVILAKGPKDTGHYEMNIDPEGKLGFYAPDLGEFSSNMVVDDNNWHHAIVTYDGSIVRIFVDGVLKSLNEANGSMADEAEPMRLGMLVDGTLPYGGLLDAVKIHHKALNANEVNYLYRNITNFDKKVYSEWMFNENAGSIAYDTAITNYSGTITGAVWSDGRYGSGLSFNGSSNNYITISNASVNIGNNFSISAWIKTGQNRSDWHVFLSKGPKDSGHFELNIDDNGNLGFNAPEIGGYSSGKVVDDNNWHHVVVTCDGSSLRFYVDKVLEDTNTVSGYVVSEVETIRLGALVDGTFPYNGLLDEVKILNHALAQTEIDALFDGLR